MKLTGHKTESVYRR